MRDLEPLSTAAAPPPGGHYAQGICWGDLVFVSGQLPVTPVNGHELAEAGFEAQARQVFSNLFAVLAAAGPGAGDVLKTTIFLSDIADWALCNALYAEAFGHHRPARSIVPVTSLHFGYRIELEAIARRG
jgi:2-iminobutanoate/2-iminopropanoate deaminase